MSPQLPAEEHALQIEALRRMRPYERLGIPYMIAGSVASVAYGEPRLTLDARRPIWT